MIFERYVLLIALLQCSSSSYAVVNPAPLPSGVDIGLPELWMEEYCDCISACIVKAVVVLVKGVLASYYGFEHSRVVAIKALLVFQVLL